MAKTKISYSWHINGFDAKINYDSKDDVIHTIHWCYKANKGDYYADMIGSHSIEYDKDNFIEYKDLKKSDVTKWLESSLDVASMQKGLSARISKKENPVDKILRPEW